MDLRSHYPYWLLHHGLVNNFPSLSKNISTEVAIIGAGISGALAAWYLCKAGFKVAIFDRRHAGMVSTVASTGILQYEIDTPLNKLINKVGEKNATRSYILCREAIYKLGDICHELNNKDVYQTKPSFQFASYKKDVPSLRKEYQLRKQRGFELDWLEPQDIQKKFGFNKPAGLLSKDGAESDAYKITQLILERCQQQGLQVYDHTTIKKILHHKKNIELVTDENKKIKARWLIMACGYESQKYLPKQIEILHSTFAIVSESMPQKKFWHKNAIIWETAQPYLYIRTTSDNRILVGGKDVESTDPAKRHKILGSKTKDLEQAFARLFPNIRFKTDFAWAGTFSSTKDGLPYIGSIAGKPRSYFSLGFGGNGITFSVIGAEIIRDHLLGKKNSDAAIFSFQR